MAINFFKINKGLSLPGTASAPSSPSDGDQYYDTGLGKYQFREAGAWTTIGSGSGGGGGSSVIWNGDSSSSEFPPAQSFENGQLVYLFQSGVTQILETVIKVPTSYTAGKPVSINIAHYSPSSSNTILLTATSYLIRANTDAVTSTANSRNTTNTALTNAVANRFRSATLDVSDSTGHINAVAISAGDMIRVQLKRGTDTDTADIRFIAGATEVTFT